MFITVCNSPEPTDFDKEISEQSHKAYFPVTDSWVNAQSSLH